MSKKILVVGAGFGANYARAIAADNTLTLAGIVGRGSSAGKKLASDMNCPYFNDLAHAVNTTKPHAAIVVVRSEMVGGDGDVLSRKLLAAGVPVLQELPIHSTGLIETFRVAKQHLTTFAINPFYDRLPALIKLAHSIAVLRTKTTVVSIELRTTIQTFLQSQLVLAALIQQPPTKLLHVHQMAGQHKWLVSSQWGDIGVDTLLQHRFNPERPDDASQPIIGLTVTTNDGELFLPSPWSGRIWERRLHQSVDSIDVFPDENITQQEMVTMLNPVEMLQQHIYGAIQDAIHALINGSINTQKQQRQLAVLRHTENITREIGTPSSATWQLPLSFLPFY